MIRFDDCALVKFLKKGGGEYSGKLKELIDEVKSLLNATGHTFPHYTSHTAEHSEGIVVRLSQILFKGAAKACAAKELNALEAYILIVAAFLHDIGMVVAEEEKLRLLGSKEWTDWIAADEARRGQLAKIPAAVLSGAGAPDFKAQYEDHRRLRFLIAEYFRERHHLRSARMTLTLHKDLGRFAYGDEILARTISDVCLGHGLRRTDLDDETRFPTLRTVRETPVNVRFLAILLRIGDLLDVSAKRACSHLRHLASPLPDSSVAHWTQYERIEHQAFSPAAIEIRASCETAEEHRLLRDWCQWIVDEVTNAPNLLAGGERHNDWRPPRASIDGAKPTIVIRPSETAKYKPYDWRFTFDEEAVLDRLIHDAYNDPAVFVRELAQNAFDATRCRVANELTQAAPHQNIDPQHAPREIREKYGIAISWVYAGKADATEEDQKDVIISVKDRGVGMTIDVIRQYLLQVGRSYYTSAEFRRAYSFVPTSRFGIGFLSAFAVSNDIVVDTLSGSPGAEPIRLRLTGKRNYVAVERSDRAEVGTTMSVRINAHRLPGIFSAQPAAEEFLRVCRELFVAVEFPIEIVTPVRSVMIFPDPSKGETFEVPHPDPAEGKIVLRHVDVNATHVRARFYWLSLVASTGPERPDLGQFFLSERFRELYPWFKIPLLPPTWQSFHGVSTSFAGSRPEFSSRPFAEGGFDVTQIDWRGNAKTSLSRSNLRFPRDTLNEVLDKATAAVFSISMQKNVSPKKQEEYLLISRIIERKSPFDYNWRRSVAILLNNRSAIRLVGNEGPVYCTANECKAREIILEEIATWYHSEFFSKKPPKCTFDGTGLHKRIYGDCLVVPAHGRLRPGSTLRSEILSARSAIAIEEAPWGGHCIRWRRSEEAELRNKKSASSFTQSNDVIVSPFDGSQEFQSKLLFYFYDSVKKTRKWALNERHSVVHFLKALSSISRSPEFDPAPWCGALLKALTIGEFENVKEDNLSRFFDIHRTLMAGIGGRAYLPKLSVTLDDFFDLDVIHRMPSGTPANNPRMK